MKDIAAVTIAIPSLLTTPPPRKNRTCTEGQYFHYDFGVPFVGCFRGKFDNEDNLVESFVKNFRRVPTIAKGYDTIQECCAENYCIIVDDCGGPEGIQCCIDVGNCTQVAECSQATSLADISTTSMNSHSSNKAFSATNFIYPGKIIGGHSDLPDLPNVDFLVQEMSFSLALSMDDMSISYQSERNLGSD